MDFSICWKFKIISKIIISNKRRKLIESQLSRQAKNLYLVKVNKRNCEFYQVEKIQISVANLMIIMKQVHSLTMTL